MFNQKIGKPRVGRSGLQTGAKKSVVKSHSYIQTRSN